MQRCLLDVGCKMKSYNNNKIHFISGGEEGNSVLEFIRKIGYLGKVSLDKFIPTEFFTASESIIENLLIGLIHTDGSVDGDNVRYYTISKQLAEDVKLLCLRLGIYASISCDNRVRKPSHHKTYKVTLRRPTRLALLHPKQLVNTRPERKKRTDRLLSIYEKPQIKIFTVLQWIMKIMPLSVMGL
jgi:intein/homing endonuclease